MHGVSDLQRELLGAPGVVVEEGWGEKRALVEVEPALPSHSHSPSQRLPMWSPKFTKMECPPRTETAITVCLFVCFLDLAFCGESFTGNGCIRYGRLRAYASPSQTGTAASPRLEEPEAHLAPLCQHACRRANAVTDGENKQTKPVIKNNNGTRGTHQHPPSVRPGPRGSEHTQTPGGPARPPSPKQAGRSR